MSSRFRLNKEDAIKIGKGVLIAAAGAGATYLLAALSNFDFGPWTPVVTAAGGILANLIRKFSVSN